MRSGGQRRFAAAHEQMGQAAGSWRRARPLGPELEEGQHHHWGWDVRPFLLAIPVKPGETVGLKVELRRYLGRQGLAFDLG